MTLNGTDFWSCVGIATLHHWNLLGGSCDTADMC